MTHHRLLTPAWKTQKGEQSLWFCWGKCFYFDTLCVCGALGLWFLFHVSILLRGKNNIRLKGAENWHFTYFGHFFFHSALHRKKNKSYGICAIGITHVQQLEGIDWAPGMLYRACILQTWNRKIFLDSCAFLNLLWKKKSVNKLLLLIDLGCIWKLNSLIAIHH